MIIVTSVFVIHKWSNGIDKTIFISLLFASANFLRVNDILEPKQCIAVQCSVVSQAHSCGGACCCCWYATADGGAIGGGAGDAVRGLTPK